MINAKFYGQYKRHGTNFGKPKRLRFDKTQKLQDSLKRLMKKIVLKINNQKINLR